MFQVSFHFKKFNLFLLITALLSSCATNSKSSVTSYAQNINLTEDFTIEGKFKIKINKKVESGYFILKKEKKMIDTKFGKNYLLPEKEFALEQDSSFKLSELVQIKGLDIQEKIYKEEISVSFLIEALLGKKGTNTANSWQIDYPNGVDIVDGFKLPPKIIIWYHDFSFELILKKIKRI